MTLPCPAPADLEPPEPPLGDPSVPHGPEVEGPGAGAGTVPPEQADEPALVVRVKAGEPGAFGPWFFRILITQALNSRRSQRVRATDELAEAVHSGDDAPDTDAERTEIRTRFAAALAALPDRQRRAVELSELEGFSSGEIAVMLDMPAGTVRWHLHQARSQLRQSLASLRSRHER